MSDEDSKRIYYSKPVAEAFPEPSEGIEPMEFARMVAKQNGLLLARLLDLDARLAALEAQHASLVTTSRDLGQAVEDDADEVERRLAALEAGPVLVVDPACTLCKGTGWGSARDICMCVRRRGVA